MTAIAVSPHLVARINLEHRMCEAAYYDALAHALQAGRLLADAKGRCEHGAWVPWLEENFDGSDRTARAYMQLAENYSETDSNWQSSADLSINRALKAIAQPSRVSDKDVRDLLTGSSTPPPPPTEPELERDPEPRGAFEVEPLAEHQPRWARVLDMLKQTRQIMDEADGPGLSSASVAEALREASRAARQAAVDLEGLAAAVERAGWF